MNQLITDEAVYRTAPATPGLLNKPITPQAPQHTGQDRNKLASQPCEELNPPLRKTFKESVSIFFVSFVIA